MKIQYTQPIGNSDYSTNGNRTVYFGIKKMYFTKTQYDFLEPLIKNPNKWMSLKEIIDNSDYDADLDYTHNTDKMVCDIRKIIELGTGKNGKKVLEHKSKEYRFNTKN